MKPHALISVLLTAFLTPAASAQVRGGYETFTNEANADSWGLYDSFDEEFYTPEWNLLQSGNPEISGLVRPDSSTSLFADSLSSNASFVGNFSANKIAGLSCDAYVDDADFLLGADFYFVSGGIYHYSIVFATPGAFSADGWDYMETSFKNAPWYIFSTGSFVEVVITDAILSNITEVGVNFYSTSDASEDITVAIDNFSLIPEKIIPTVSIVKNGGNIELGFQRETGQIYDILQSPTLNAWSELPGYTGITGNGNFIATDPLAVRKFFRVATEEFYTPIPNVTP